MDTKLFSRHQPGGFFAVVDRELVPSGTVFWVNSATGTNGAGYGRNPDAPLATLDYAIGLCTASAGDIIYLMPGHAENLATATAVNCDVAGVRIIGLGEGALIPTLSTTAAAGSVTIAAANVLIKNVRLTANFATGTTTMVTWAAAGENCILDGVQFRDTSATSEALIHISVATAAIGMTIRNCSFIGAAGTLSNSILFAGTSTDTVIENCYFFVDSSDSVIDHAAGASVNLFINHCIIINQDTDAAGYCIEQKSDGSGVVADCRLAYNKNNAEVGVGAATWWFETYATNTIGTSSGVLDPAAGAAVP